MSKQSATGNVRVDGARILARLAALADIAPLPPTGSCRLALTDADKAGRDMLAGWFVDVGMTLHVDQVGNMFGVLEGNDTGLAPIMCGSHIDTVATGGRYDGAYGVVAALEVCERLKETGIKPRRSIVVAAFTNEEGARFQPDMLGSLVYAGGMTVEAARDTRAIDGANFGEELARIGYDGQMIPGSIRPAAYVELHIEQGPVLDVEGVRIGAVENLQGISWQEITLEGQSNHAGTTPISMRRDAGVVLGEVIVFLRALANDIGHGQVSTVGRIEVSPNLINVVPARVVFTVDLRNPDEMKLREAESRLAAFLDETAKRHDVAVSSRRLARFEPVIFDDHIVKLIEAGADSAGLSCRRMTSGAGHDAQMLARVCPTAMIFVPSQSGLSHNPNEHTEPADLEAGANVLMATLLQLANEGAST